MKRSILVSLFALFAYIASAQSLKLADFCGYDDLHRYYNGCLSIAQAEVAPKSEGRYFYEDAIGFLSPVLEDAQYVNRYRDAALVSVDTDSLISVDGRLQYTYEYARKKYLDVVFNEVTILRGEESKDAVKCRVKNFAVKANSTVKFKDIMDGISIVVVMCEPNAQIGLSVVSDTTLQGTSYENGMVSYCKWVSAEEQDFIYCIENKSNKDISVVLLAN